jgi:hypothetical protein
MLEGSEEATVLALLRLTFTVSWAVSPAATSVAGIAAPGPGIRTSVAPDASWRNSGVPCSVSTLGPVACLLNRRRVIERVADMWKLPAPSGLIQPLPTPKCSYFHSSRSLDCSTRTMQAVSPSGFGPSWAERGTAMNVYVENPG